MRRNMHSGGSSADGGLEPSHGSDDRIRGIVSNGRCVFRASEWNAIVAALRLSPRESEIIRHLFNDDKQSAIAHALGMSPSTVHTHFERVYRKLSVHSRCQLIVRIFAEYRQLDAAAGFGVGRAADSRIAD